VLCGGLVHCRCSRCFSFPSKRRVRKRPRVLTLLSLPEDVLLHVLKGLPAEDILSLRAVSAGPSCSALPYFCPREPEVHAGTL
uniref:F-box domain-containing protein n=1 Tax=Pavo cristatus TaxID=9049 RepID=A0A8C9FTH1_PAVCR